MLGRRPIRILRRGGWLRAAAVPAAVALGLVATLAASPAAAGFDLEQVAAKAQKLAEEPYKDTKGRVPEWLLEVSYDQWRDIRFRSEYALWAKRRLPFQVQFFHPGLYYDRTVTINAVDSEGVHPQEFSPSQFDYGKNDFASRVPQDLGYAGFRVHYPIKTPTYHDEVIVFLGATYFRAVGSQQVFGISARGLAIDTASPSGEEFPYFKEFWLIRPAPEATDMTIYALLDSPSVTGAYRFVVYPGQQTIVDVEMKLFRRKEVKKLGIAAMTSMFFYGENTLRDFDNFRPEVHDSDGVAIASSTGEWLWRPLDNPETLQVNSFGLDSPNGFGILQRDRNFDHYQDLETHFEQRPSVWVNVHDAWGKGRVEVVEIPTRSDANDNVVTYWVPEQLPEVGKPITFAYRTQWYGDDPTRPPGGRVVATRRDRAGSEDLHRFVVDFDGKKLQSLDADTVLRGVITVASGPNQADVVEKHVVKNPVSGGWRLVFKVKPKTNDPIELRAFLDMGGEALTETWSYVLRP